MDQPLIPPVNINVPQQPLQQQATPQQTIEEYVNKHQEMWSQVVKDLNNGLKKFVELPDLMNVVYAKRQDALEYYFSLLDIVSTMNNEYRSKYAARYNAYKVNAQIRYNSDAAIKMQIEADLAADLHKLEVLSNLSEYMKETIKTIDDIIYGIPNRIKIEELINQVKK